MDNVTNNPVYDEVVLALGFSLESILEDRQVPVVIPARKPTKRERHKVYQRQNTILANEGLAR